MAAHVRSSSGVAGFFFGVIVTLLTVAGWFVWIGFIAERAPPQDLSAGIELPLPDLPDRPLPPPTDPLPKAD